MFRLFYVYFLKFKSTINLAMKVKKSLQEEENIQKTVLWLCMSNYVHNFCLNSHKDFAHGHNRQTDKQTDRQTDRQTDMDR